MQVKIEDTFFVLLDKAQKTSTYTSGYCIAFAIAALAVAVRELASRQSR